MQQDPVVQTFIDIDNTLLTVSNYFNLAVILIGLCIIGFLKCKYDYPICTFATAMLVVALLSQVSGLTVDRWYKIDLARREVSNTLEWLK